MCVCVRAIVFQLWYFSFLCVSNKSESQASESRRQLTLIAEESQCLLLDA